MYRRLLLSLYQTRNRAIYRREACVLTTKCDTVTLPFRVANGVAFRTLGTTSTTYCEKKEGSLHPKKDIDNNAKKDGESEAANVGEKKVEPPEEDRMTVESVGQMGEIKTEAEHVNQLRNETKNVILEGAIKHEENKNIDAKKLTVEVQMEAETVTQLRDGIKSEILQEATKHEEMKHTDSEEQSAKFKMETENVTEVRNEIESVNFQEVTEKIEMVEVKMDAENVIQFADEIKSGISQEVTGKIEVEEVKMDAENVIQLVDEIKSVNFEEVTGKIEVEEVKMDAENVIQLADEIKSVNFQEVTEKIEVVEVKMDAENVIQLADEIKSVNFQEVTEKIEVVEVKMDAENVIQFADEMKSGISQEATEHKEGMETAEEPAPVVNMEVSKTEEHTAQTVKEGLKHQTEEPVKNVKESLLDLLGAMKVEITTKKSIKALKVQSRSNSVARPKPAEMESTISMFQEASSPAPPQSESTEMMAAVSAAASTLPNPPQAESELLRQLKQQEALADAQKTGDVTNIGNIIADMKVGKRPSPRQNAWSTNQIRFDEDEKSTLDRGIMAEMEGARGRRSLFSRKRMNIFNPTTEKPAEADTHSASPTLWDIELANEVALSANLKSRNGLEEMIKWTREGRLWQYPINNEAGLEEEAGVPFHEHVFLERHLEEGFPRQGPVRHFMELVLVGLSHNPHLTVSQKEQHITWFRDYFQQKEEVLKEAEVYLN
ncbi:28S ribosomal protein S31, mitochondrial [Hypomesus transpacificus]|uniref:28S ribosomal protein S31, mitochondrial n=1 Tax=Hypomesus transpacificus TaxID=137520 RepID=UPI001F0834B0|nr:28S ribosomal protein S31, mitochondrial [Hypomesus transpacificus]